MPKVELRLLGPPELLHRGRRVRLRSLKSYALLAYLALEGPTPRERLAALLWDTPSGRGNLRVEVHRLAQTLPGVFARRRGVLALAELDLDVAAFEAAVRSADWPRAQALYRGPFLEGLEVDASPEFADWTRYQRTRLQEARRTVLVELARRAAPQEAVAHWLRLLAEDPLDAAACRGAMTAYLRLGEAEKALRLYREQAELLERELGLPPEPETRALARFISSGERPAPAGAPPFVGREPELGRLEQALAAGQAVFVTGEPGIGKTRLLLEFARAKGVEPFLLRGRPGDAAVPYATLARALREYLEAGFDPEPWARRELARLLPELGEAPPEPNPARLLAAVAQALEPFKTPDRLWGIDDLQYVDPASLGLVTGLAHLVDDRPGIVTYRRGRLDPAAAAWIEDRLAAGRAIELTLEPLGPEAVARMLDVDGERARALARYTGGNPFFLSRLRHGDPQTADLQQLVARRLRQASAPAQKLCELAAVAGAAYAPALAAAALGLRPLALAEASDELEQLGLFRKGQPAHDLVVESVLAELSEATRRHLHLSVAEALERLPKAPPAAVALHFERAGHPERATRHHLAAARAAERVFAYREALAQYRLAVDSAPPEAAPDVEVETMEARYRILLALLDWDGAEQLLRRAEELARAPEREALRPAVRLGWAGLHFNRWELDRAEAIADELLEGGGLEPRLRAEALYIRAVAVQARGEHRRALEDVRTALEAHPGTAWAYHGWAHNTAAISLTALGELERAEEHNRAALAHFQRWGDLAGEANAHRVFAEIAAAGGRYDEADRLHERALEQARRSGHREVLGYVLASALLHHERLGRTERVRALAREGAELQGPYREFFRRRLA